MEQQTISVAKAGLVCKLNTRTTILAATNPKGQYDPNESVSVNIALGSPLLSRFDLVLVLLDKRNEEWDRIISSFILENKSYPSVSEKFWTMEKMKTYFCLVKSLQPTLTDESNLILVRYYQMQRQSDCRNAARTTIRLLESLIRLAEAHARLMFRDTVTVEDAVTVVSVMESSMQGGALLGGVNALHTSFPEMPTEQYRMQCKLILEKMELQGLLHEELKRLDRLQNENTYPSPQSPEICSNATEGRLNQHTLGQSEQMSQQQLDKEDNNGQLQPPLAKRNLEGDMRPIVLNRQKSDDNRVTGQQSKHNDGSLNWFDSIVSGNSETEKSIYFRSQESLELKTPSNAHCSKEKKSLRETKQAKMGESLARTDPGGPSGQTVVSSLQRQRTEKPTSSFSGANKKDPEASCSTMPDSVITERASKKWQQENLKRVRGFCTSTPDPKAEGPLAPLSPHPAVPTKLPARDLQTCSSHNEPLMHGKLENLARKRSRDQTKEGDMTGSSNELETLENSGPTAPKLAKFSFRQKPRLAHFVENNNSAKLPETICVPHSGTSNVSKGEKTSEERAEKNQLEQSNNVGNNSKEKQPCGNKGEKQQQHKVLSSSPTKKARLGEETLNPKKVCSDTLAKLARFSFVPRLESKPDSHTSFNVTRNDEERQGQPLKTQMESAGHRRRCFELGKASIVRGKSLFSITDFDDSVLDLDWDEEIQKKS